MISPTVKHSLAQRINLLMQPTGYSLVSTRTREHLQKTDIEYDSAFMAIYEACRADTMTSIERMYALFKAVDYVVDQRVPGAFVECGVWRGGSSAAIARRLLDRGDTDRSLYLYDTYAGMPPPSPNDVDRWGRNAANLLDQSGRSEEIWCVAGKEQVKATMAATGYRSERIDLVEGRVEDTLPVTAPAQIALLRLDTDWYESTYHELVHLYPRLSPGGVLILDDYGWWQGARKAVDEYFAQVPSNILLSRIDDSGRIGVKVA